MAETIPFRFEPKNIPDDWREESLHRAAIWLNRDDEIPAIFPEDSLDYLWDLAYVLPRKGILFITTARGFILRFAMAAFPVEHATAVTELRTLWKRTEDAVANGDFDTAAAIGDGRRELQKTVAKIPIHEITRDGIRTALLRVGVDPDGDA